MQRSDLKALSVVDALYDAALHPDQWPQALHALQSLFRGSGTLLFSTDREKRVPFNLTVDISDHAREEYNQHYIKQCPKLAYVARNPFEQHVYDYKYIDESTINRDEYYAWQQHAVGTRYFVGSRLHQDAGHAVYLAIKRTRKVGHIGRSEFALYTRLATHLERAVRLSRQLGYLESKVQGLEETLRAAPFPTILLDQTGRVAHINAAAESLLAAADGLDATVGTLRATQSVDDVRLQLAIGQALTGDLLATSQTRDVVFVNRPSGKRAYLLRVIPLRASTQTMTELGCVAVGVFITDFERPVDAEQLPLVALYRLTPSEARLAAALASGKTLLEIATEFGIRRSTARLHLERVLHKTGTHRQSELVRLVLQTSGHVG